MTDPSNPHRPDGDGLRDADLTDEAILQILIDRERSVIIGQRRMMEEAAAENQRIKDYIKKYGTDEG